MPRKILDTHFHLWDLELRRGYSRSDGSFDWPGCEACLRPIYRDILAPEAEQEMKKSGVEAAIFVQCLNRCPEEVSWVTSLAEQHPFIKGMVGGLDLEQEEEELKKQIKGMGDFLVGVRHIIDVEDVDWLLRAEVSRGLKVLAEEGKVFDCLVRPPTLGHVATIARQHPSLRLVVDHIAKPRMSLGREEGLVGWSEDLARVAACPNVYCKLSGLVTEADPDRYLTPWTAATFLPYTQLCLELFGPDRCMFGSDWPVCALAGASHTRVVRLLEELMSDLGEEEKQKIFYDNAVTFYNLKL